MAISLVNIFNWSVILSIFMVIGFYWPNHDTIIVKMTCWQMSILFLIGLGIVNSNARKVNDIYPGLLLIYCIINSITHGLSGGTLLATTIVLLFSLGVYVLSNNISINYINTIKKSIVIFGLINAVSFILEKYGVKAPFTMTPSTLPTGFMSYPAHLSLLLSIALFFSLEWRKILSIPLLVSLVMVNEFSCFIGLGICLFTLLKSKRDLIVIGSVFIFISVILLIIFHNKLSLYLYHRSHIRLSYWLPMFEYGFSRIIDGCGIGNYPILVDKVLPNMPKGAWLWLHNELLQGFIEGGIILVALLVAWGIDLFKKFHNVYYEKPYMCSFIMFFCVSMGHSPFHFSDTLYLFMIIYAMFHVEHYEANLKWKLNESNN